MIATLAVAVAAAQPITQGDAHRAINELYGSEVPSEAVCAKPTDLPTLFKASTAAVGVKRGAEGCKLAGVVVDGKVFKPEDAAEAAIDGEAWASAEDTEKAKAIAKWVDEVLLAFARPDPDTPRVRRTSRGYDVLRTYVHRTNTKNQTAKSAGSWTFGAKGEQLGHNTEELQRWSSRFFVRPDRLEGVEKEVVVDALTSYGRVIKDCYHEAWTRNPALQGRIRLEWTIANGEATDLSVIGGDSPDMELAKCYARAVRSIQFPDDASGDVRWVFAVERSEVE